MWTGNLGSSILRVQQSGDSAMSSERISADTLEKMPEEGDLMAEGSPRDAVKNYLEYSIIQIEAMIDLVRGDLDRRVFDRSYFVRGTKGSKMTEEAFTYAGNIFRSQSRVQMFLMGDTSSFPRKWLK